MSRTASAILLLLSLAALVILPLFSSANMTDAAIKMMIAALFALSFALAIGQAGMLSFGHAAYYGFGAFAALHLMRAVEMNVLYFPTPLVPLASAAAGALIGIIFGWLATQRKGVYFAMLTFALSELVYSVAPGLNTIFGWAFTRTPLGRLALALRDNEHRVRFLGFDARLSRTLIFTISCTFAGLAGGLLAMANESANYTVFAGTVSASIVLYTFIGGVGTFFGPALGAAAMTYFARIMSDLTRSWLLYQGLVFVLMMLFAPGGLGGIVSLHARKIRPQGWHHLLLPYLLCLVVGMMLLAGTVYMVESIHLVMSDAYQVKRESAGGDWVPYMLFGRTFEPFGLITWLIPTGLLGASLLLLPPVRRMTDAAWRIATEERHPESHDAHSAAGDRQDAKK
jgi:branched-chain amino acid transport system permease protein